MRSLHTDHTDHPDRYARRGTLENRSMNDMLQLYDPYHAVNDRIHDLYETAADLRAGRHAAAPRSGLVTRVRSSLGRRLVSFGSSLSGQHA